MDVDGDGLSDAVTVFLFSDTWYITMRLASNDHTTTLALDDLWAAAHDEASIGPARLEGGRRILPERDVAVVRISAGLAQSYAVFALDACQVRVAARTDASLPDLWALGSPMHSDLPLCGTDGYVTMAQFGAGGGAADLASATDITYTWSRYQLVGDPVRFVDAGSSVETISRAQMEALLATSCLGSGT
jgi:hypothetical protein